jgi:hypothetical protein
VELDDLKYIWQQNQELSISQQVIDNEKVMEMTRQKSKDVMMKLRKNLDFDAIVSGLFIPPMIYIIFVKNIAIYHKYIAGLFIIFIFVGLYYYLKEINSYKELNLKNDLLSTLKFTEQKFSKRVKSLLFYNNIAAIPMGFYGYLACSQLGHHITGRTHEITPTELIIAGCLNAPVGYFYMRFIIKKLYGEHLQKLKQLLTELEQN